MPTDILMPALSPTMTEGKLARWLKQEGSAVASGEALAEIETDKATMEIEAPDDGRLARIFVPQGSEGIAVGTPIALLHGDDEAPVVLSQSSKEVASAGPNPVIPAGLRAFEPTVPAAVSVAGGSIDEEKFFTKVTTQTVREALRDAMAEEMRRDPAVFVMGEEVAEYQGAYKVTQGLLQEFGERRVIDTPITEHGFAGLGVGAGFYGLRPVIEFMTMNFAMQAMDQIVNSAAKTLYMSGGSMNCPIVFRGPNGAAARVAAQHSQCYASWYAHCPGLTVIAPYSAADAKGLLKAAIRYPSPVVFLEHELLYGHSFEVPVHDDFVLPIGRAKVVRQGDDVTIVGFSRMVAQITTAARALAEQGIEAEIVDLRTLRPLDLATVVASVSKTNRIVSVEEGWPYAGIGAELAAVMMEHAFDDLDAPPVRVHGADVPLPYAANLEALALPQPENIVQAARAVCYRN